MNQAHPDKQMPDAACTESGLPLLCVSGRHMVIMRDLLLWWSVKEQAQQLFSFAPMIRFKGCLIISEMLRLH